MEFLTSFADMPGASFLWKAVTFLVALSIIVFIHEYGHFKIARLCGVKVDTFSLGFGREIWGFHDRYGTRWKFAWLPLGGYVKFEGDMNAASQPDAAATPVEGSFHTRPLWQRAAVVAAGPLANFVLAIAIFAGAAFFMGIPHSEPRIDGVLEGSAAEKGGIKPGDIVKSIAGKEVVSFFDITEAVRFRADEDVVIVVDRKGEILSLNVTIGSREEKDSWNGVVRLGFLGVSHDDRGDRRYEKKGLGASLAHGLDRTWFIVEVTFRFIGKIFMGTESTQNLGGVLSMANAAGNAASAGIMPYIGLIGFLSVSIGLINLFPIPMLDGGHLVFYAIEAVRRKPLGAQAQEWSFRIGFAVVIGLMLLGNGNDILLRAIPNIFGSAAP